jgi:hypothetical protein
VRDGAFLDIEKEAAAALDAGYGGERNVVTWRAHLKVLKDLGFVDYKPGPSGPCEFILLWNPLPCCEKTESEGLGARRTVHRAIRKRALEIDATDLDAP